MLHVQIPNVEDAPEVEVGREYMVDCVRTFTHSIFQGEWIPITGPLHEDREIIRFVYEHYHIDWRFVTQALMEHVEQTTRREHPDRLDIILLGFPLSIGHAIGKGAPQKRMPLRCKRPSALWPDKNVVWLAELERAFINKRACHDICPHRGISLVGAPEDPHCPGARVCPGHGLAWDRSTGALRPRAWINEDFEKMFAPKL
jgi:hypothetical protein